MRVGIIGSGTVGKNLGVGWIRAGHEVTWSSRSPDEAKRAEASELGGRLAGIDETIAFGDVIVLAVPGHQVPDVIESHTGWSGKVLIDATNEFGPAPHANPSRRLADLSRAKVVKCFNTLGAEHFLDPVFSGRAATMFLAGEDPDAVGTVSTLASDLGFQPVPIDGLDQAPLLDALARLWVGLVRAGRGRDFAITLIGK